MKTFNASQLSHDRREILNAARDEGAIIQVKNTNGDVLEEFVMVSKSGVCPMSVETSDGPKVLYIIQSSPYDV